MKRMSRKEGARRAKEFEDLKKNRDLDNDPFSTTPKAWKHAKEALGNIHCLAALTRSLENVARQSDRFLPEDWEQMHGCCPRLLLAIALHHLVSASDEDRGKMTESFRAWIWEQKARQGLLEQFESWRSWRSLASPDLDRAMDELAKLGAPVQTTGVGS